MKEPSADAQYIGDQIRAGLQSIADRIAGGPNPENVAMSTRDIANAVEEMSGGLQNALQQLSESIEHLGTNDSKGG